MENLELFIESVPLILAVFFSLYFYLNKTIKSKSNNYLSLFFVSFSLVQVFLVFSDLTDNNFGKLLLPLIVGGSLIIPPSMYFYVNSLTLNVKSLNFKKQFFLGALFFIINVIVFSTVIFFKENETIIAFIVPILNFTTLFPIAVIFPILSIYYIFNSFKSIQKHQTDIGEVYSYEDGISLQWVKVFLFGFVCWFIAVVLDGFVNYGSIQDENFIGQHTYDFVTSAYIIFIGIKAMQQSAINLALANSQKVTKEEIDEEENTIIENETDQNKFLEVWNKSEAVMNLKSPYKNVELTIYDLAKLLETNYKYLSKAINLNSNQNFVSYINSYRVEESKQLLKNTDYDNYTIEALAEMSGFKSKSAFNTAFKKITGQTPSEFKKS